MELNSRLEPHLERYHRITHEDMNYDGDVSEHQRNFVPVHHIFYKRSQSSQNSSFVLSNQDDGRRDAQRVQNLVSQTLHYISHIYHHISDLMIDMNTQPPRQVRAPPTSIVQQAPADITISPRVIRRNNATSQTTSSSTSTTSGTTSSNVSLKLEFLWDNEVFLAFIIN